MVWAAAAPIRPGEDGPADRWARSKVGWPLDAPLPDALRYLPEGAEVLRLRTGRRGGGWIAAPLAAPAAWRAAAPGLPQPQAVQVIRIGPDGGQLPVTSKGGSKLYIGPTGGAVVLLGDAGARRATVSEGVADALGALRPPWAFGFAAIAATNDAGMRSPALADWAASALDAVTVYADDNTPGRRAAHVLREGLRWEGVNAVALVLSPYPALPVCSCETAIYEGCGCLRCDECGRTLEPCPAHT